MENDKALKNDVVKYVKVRITEEVQETTERWAERIVRVPSEWDDERIENEVMALFLNQLYEGQWDWDDWDDEDCDEIDSERQVEVYDAPLCSDEVSKEGEDIWNLAGPGD